MNHRWLPLACFLLALPAAAAAQADPSTSETLTLASLIDDEFATDTDRWDRPELQLFDAVSIVDGEPTTHTLRIATVAEDLNREFYTKADFPYGQKPLLAVLRQTITETVPGPNPQHRSATVFALRNDIDRAARIAVSTQDADGEVYKQFQMWKPTPLWVYHSIRDGEGDGERPLARVQDAYFEEQLPLALRALKFSENLEGYFWLYPSQLVHRAPEPRAVPAQVQTHPKGRQWQVVVEAADGRRIEYLFDAEWPRPLAAMIHTDGREWHRRTGTKNSP